MPEKFDFSKIEDQKKFETLPAEKQEKIKDEAWKEAEKMKRMVASGETKNYEEAAENIEFFDLEKEYDKADKKIEEFCSQKKQILEKEVENLSPKEYAILVGSALLDLKRFDEIRFHQKHITDLILFAQNLMDRKNFPLDLAKKAEDIIEQMIYDAKQSLDEKVSYIAVETRTDQERRLIQGGNELWMKLKSNKDDAERQELEKKKEEMEADEKAIFNERKDKIKKILLKKQVINEYKIKEFLSEQEACDLDRLYNDEAVNIYSAIAALNREDLKFKDSNDPFLSEDLRDNLFFAISALRNEYAEKHTKKENDNEASQVGNEYLNISRLQRRAYSRLDFQEYANYYRQYLKNIESSEEHLFKSVLGNSILVDLGCGEKWSIEQIVNFASQFNIGKYTGVDKHISEEEIKEAVPILRSAVWKNRYNRYEDKKKIGKSSSDFPKYELIKQDMLEYLAQARETANFTMNGIDATIFNHAEDSEYLEEVFKHIARLTPTGGIVFGCGNSFLSKLEKYGFKKVLSEEGIRPEVWQKD